MPKPWDENPGVRHGFSKRSELFRPGSTNNRSDGTIRLIVCRLCSNRLNRLCNMVIDMVLTNLQILEILSSGIGGFDQHKEAGVLGGGSCNKWFDGIHAKVGIDGKCISGPWSGKPAGSIGFGC